MSRVFVLYQELSRVCPMDPSNLPNSTLSMKNSSTRETPNSMFTFTDGTTLEQLKNRWLCRAEVVTLLWRFLGCRGDDSWPYASIVIWRVTHIHKLTLAFRFLFLHGPSGTGKSHIIQDYCSHINCPTAFVDCVGTSTTRCVFESVLNQFARHIPCEANSYTNFCRCDDMSAFVHHLKKLLVRSLGLFL